MRRGSYLYSLIVLMIVAVIGFSGMTSAYAQQEQAQSENKVVRFFKDVFNWPFGITKKSAEAVGRTTEKATMTVTDTGTAAVETVTGKPERIKDVVVDPVKGSADTAYTAVEGTAKAPIEGTKEAFEK